MHPSSGHMLIDAQPCLSKQIRRTREYPLLCSPVDAMPRTTSPASRPAAVDEALPLDDAYDKSREVVLAFGVHARASPPSLPRSAHNPPGGTPSAIPETILSDHLWIEASHC